MTDLEPGEPGALVHRGAGRVVVPERFPAAGRPGSRPLVGARVGALTTGPLLPVVALAAVTAVTAARAAVRAVRGTRWDGEPVGRAVSGRGAASSGPAATVQVSWTHVEIRLR